VMAITLPVKSRPEGIAGMDLGNSFKLLSFLKDDIKDLEKVS
jgi:hypothetical protein